MGNYVIKHDKIYLIVVLWWHIATWPGSTLALVRACLTEGTKSLPEPIYNVDISLVGFCGIPMRAISQPSVQASILYNEFENNVLK